MEEKKGQSKETTRDEDRVAGVYRARVLSTKGR